MTREGPGKAEYDYEKDLSIDKHRLDDELIFQPRKMMKYNTAHAQAQLDRDKAKQNLDVVKANLDSKVRADLVTAGARFTEAVVDGRIKTHPEFIAAQNNLHKAEHTVNLTFAGVMAMNARRPILEDLVRLYLSGYWSEPRVSGETKASFSQSETEASIMRSQEIPPQPPLPPNPIRPRLPTPKT